MTSSQHKVLQQITKIKRVPGFEPSDYAEQKHSEFQEWISNFSKLDLHCIAKIAAEGHIIGNR